VLFCSLLGLCWSPASTPRPLPTAFALRRRLLLRPPLHPETGRFPWWFFRWFFTAGSCPPICCRLLPSTGGSFSRGGTSPSTASAAAAFGGRRIFFIGAFPLPVFARENATGPLPFGLGRVGGSTMAGRGRRRRFQPNGGQFAGLGLNGFQLVSNECH
jgi:hypothetical protein